MKIAVLGSPTSWYLADLKRAAAGQHQIDSVPFSRLTSHIGAEKTLVSSTSESHAASLESYDALLVRTMPPGSLEQVVFRMDALALLEASGVRVVNSPRAIEVAVDKYLASARLLAAGLATPETQVSQTAEDAMLGFEALGGDVVIKPLFGGEGRGVTRVSDPDLALRAFKMLETMNAVIYQQRFVSHKGYDLRLLAIGQRVFGMRRVNATDWRTNISRGARAEAYDVSDSEAALARQAANAVGAILAGVDVLHGDDGTPYVIEVNAAPGWQALDRVTQTDVSAEVLQLLVG